MRPDMLAVYRTGLSGAEISPLSEQSQQRILDQIATMLKTANSDWSTYLPVSGEIDMDWVDAADRYYDTERIAELIETSDPEDFSNEFLVTVCQFGAVLGYMMRLSEPRLEWVAEWPYWESSLYDPATGNIIPPFHWAMKKFSDYGVNDGFVPKISCMVHILNNPEDKS